MSPSLRGLLSGAAAPREPLGGAKVKVKRLPKPFGVDGRSHVTAGKQPGRTGLRRAITGRRVWGGGGGGGVCVWGAGGKVNRAQALASRWLRGAERVPSV